MNSKWWYWVALQPAAVAVFILIWIVTIAIDGVPTGNLFTTTPLTIFAGIYTYVVIAIHFIVLFAYVADTKAITNTENCEWNPSGAAYAGLGLFFGSFVALWYLRNRRQYLNTP